MVTNEWGQMEEAVVEKVLADWGPEGTTPTFRVVAAVPEDLADEFPSAFPAWIFSFRSARVITRDAIQTSEFASLAEGRYTGLTYAESGKTTDKNRYGEKGVYELEKLVRTSIMGWAPGHQQEINEAPLFWEETGPATLITRTTKAGSALMRMRTEFSIEQLVTATAT